jgi:transposase-like protein
MARCDGRSCIRSPRRRCHFFAVAGLVALAAGSRLTEDWWALSAWAGLRAHATELTRNQCGSFHLAEEATMADQPITIDRPLCGRCGKATEIATILHGIGRKPDKQVFRCKSCGHHTWFDASRRRSEGDEAQ